MGKVFRLPCLRIEPFFCPVLGSRHCTNAYTETIDPASQESEFQFKRRRVGPLPLPILLYYLSMNSPNGPTIPPLEPYFFSELSIVAKLFSYTVVTSWWSTAVLLLSIAKLDFSKSPGADYENFDILKPSENPFVRGDHTLLTLTIGLRIVKIVKNKIFVSSLFQAHRYLCDLGSTHTLVTLCRGGRGGKYYFRVTL